MRYPNPESDLDARTPKVEYGFNVQARNFKALASDYHKNGFVNGVSVLGSAQAQRHRSLLEHAESVLGRSLHYVDKAHTALPSPFELATMPTVLDVVEALIGPDILLYNSTYIIKEPGTTTKVKWHQDLTYWGLADSDAQISMWLALAPATGESGAMAMLPESHKFGAIEHQTGSDDGNLLLLGQQITKFNTAGPNPSDAVLCALEPGEASFHHGWTVHSSQPNTSNDRRIGLNVQYLAPHNRMSDGVTASAMLVRGTDDHGNFTVDHPPPDTLDQRALASWHEADAQMKANFQQEQQG